MNCPYFCVSHIFIIMNYLQFNGETQRVIQITVAKHHQLSEVNPTFGRDRLEMIVFCFWLERGALWELVNRQVVQSHSPH